MQPPPAGAIPARHLAALWAGAFVASAAIGTHGPVYWDAGDYVWQAMTGEPSGLLLGRPLFLLASRLILAAGLDPAWAEPVLRWFWSAVSATAAPAMALLCVRLDLDRRAALAAGAALALSPSFAHTSHQVLTDGPALALAIAALAVAARGRAFAAGLVLAMAIAMRETAAIQILALCLLLGRRAVAAVAGAAIGVAIILWLFPPIGLRQWTEMMSLYAGTQRVNLALVGMALAWVFAAGPVVVAIGAARLFRERRARWFLVSLPSAIATIALLFYPDGSFSPRYVLATVPIAFFPAAAPWLAASIPRAAIVLLLPMLFMPWITRESRDVNRAGLVAQARVAALPANAVVVPGHFCPQSRLGAAIASRTDLTFVCPGWAWPADVNRVLDEAVQSHRPIAVDLDVGSWPAPHETVLLEQVRRWVAGQGSYGSTGLVLVQR